MSGLKKKDFIQKRKTEVVNKTEKDDEGEGDHGGQEPKRKKQKVLSWATTPNCVIPIPKTSEKSPKKQKQPHKTNKKPDDNEDDNSNTDNNKNNKKTEQNNDKKETDDQETEDDDDDDNDQLQNFIKAAEKKIAKKKKKAGQKKKIENAWVTNSLAATIFLGFDISKRSPGTCLLNIETKEIHIIAFARNRKQFTLWQNTKKDQCRDSYTLLTNQDEKDFKVNITLFEPIQSTTSKKKKGKNDQDNENELNSSVASADNVILCETWQKVFQRLDSILGIDVKTETWLKKNICCVMEGFYVDDQKQNTAVILGQIHGIVRYHLWKRYCQFHVLTPGQIKKAFSGSGSATKWLMWTSFLTQTQQSALGLTFLHPPIKVAKESDIDSDSDLDSDSSSTKDHDIPCPHQDIVDSFAMCFASWKNRWTSSASSSKHKKKTASKKSNSLRSNSSDNGSDNGKGRSDSVSEASDGKRKTKKSSTTSLAITKLTSLKPIKQK